jgi:hypothetical protein
MQQKSLELFVNLLESVVLEDSTVLPVVQGNDAATQLVTALHKNGKLSHNAATVAQPQMTDKQLVALLNKLTNETSTYMVILATSDKAVAMSVGRSDDKFTILAANGKLKTERLGWYSQSYATAVKAKLKGLGINPTNVSAYVIKQPATYVTARRKTKNKLTPVAQRTLQFKSTDDFTKMLVTKFKPLWIRALEAAKADIKGYVSTQIKNNAYDLIQPKVERLAELEDALTDLELDPSMQSVRLIAHSVNNAIVMAAYHFYPEQSRTINRNWNRSLNRYVPTTHKDGVTQLFDDIASGDMTKLSAVLAFFKRDLIST